ncbi:MAG: MAPEG family protein [Sphingomonadales bacterium]|nr:MAPEG family protein [Sphingomonadales bacterium]
MATSFARGKFKQGLGDGGHRPLEIAIRRHGNFIENAPILLIVLWLLELAGTDGSWLVALGVLIVAERVTHAIGVTVSPDKPHPLRFFGAMSTVLIGATGGIALIGEALHHV